jgi:enamine deaminase RidA (YjgF/YER057c/UK114 family)
MDYDGQNIRFRKSMTRQVIHTENAPAAIGTYSQAILVGNTLYFQVKLV